MTPAIRTEGLGKRYGRQDALLDVTLTVPGQKVVGLVGPNGAGKSTFLGLACGLLTPTSGSITVLGERPAANAAQLARVGFVAQDTPVYRSLPVADHLRLGARLNPRWDEQLAQQRIRKLGLDPRKKAGHLSGGQRAQLALTLAAAKRPELLIFDEPVASLDPLARREFLQSLMEFVAELGVSVVLSSHLIADLERVCDHLIVLASGHVQVAGDVEDLLATHYRVVAARGDFDALSARTEVILAEHTKRQTTFVVRTGEPRPPSVEDAAKIDLEELVLAYLARAAGESTNGNAERALEAQR